MKKYASAAALLLALQASALPVIGIDSVAQRWPWNNKVDITYTISGEGGQDVKSSRYCKVVFVVVAGDSTYTIDGARDLIAWADNGTHTVTWTNAPSGVSISDCRMSAKLYRTDGYYMIVDLGTGAYAFDDLEDGDTPTATPTASVARYNTALYKSDRMVLRRVPRTSLADSTYAGGYPTGDDVNYSSTNGRTNWITDADYFIGVFTVTKAQWRKLGIADPSVRTSEYSGDVVLYRPVEDFDGGLWDLREQKNTSAALSSDVNSAYWLPRLNGRTGIVSLTGTAGFDLPTEVMWEIACRAGATTVYPWGDTASDGSGYVIDSTQVTQGYCREVGKLSPNVWGLYDMIGNVKEACIDGSGSASVPNNLKNAASPWTPMSTGGYWALRGGNTWGALSSQAWFRASHREFQQSWSNSSHANAANGFRVAFIAR